MASRAELVGPADLLDCTSFWRDMRACITGMDLSNCELSGISISGGELRGAKVNLEQAAMLGQLLAGVLIQYELPRV